MLKPVSKLESGGVLLVFTHQEGLGFWSDGRFSVELLHQKLVEKILALLSPQERVNARGQMVPMEEFSVKKAPRRFWGRQLLGYYIVRLHFGRGEYRRTVSFRYVRSSEDNFNGHVFHHPVRRNRAK